MATIESTEVTTSEKEDTTTVLSKATPLSDRGQAWCRKVADLAYRRAFRVREYADTYERFRAAGGGSSFSFFLLPKLYQRKRISHNNSNGSIYLHPDFFDAKGSPKKGLGKTLRDELKAAIFSEIAHHAIPRVNAAFFKIMVRCPWVGARVEGAKGSEHVARTVLAERRQKRLAQRRKMNEVATGLKEQVKFWDLTTGTHVTVEADIFIADGKLKIARAEYQGRKLRTMLPGAAALLATAAPA